MAALALSVAKTIFQVACQIKLYTYFQENSWKEFQGAKINLRSLANSTKAKRRTEWGSPQIRQSLTFNNIKFTHNQGLRLSFTGRKKI